MFGAKKPDFSTREKLAAFEAEASACIRAMSFDGAQKLILQPLYALGGHYALACRRIADRYVAIDGWDEVAADLAAAERSHKKITGIGIDLSGHGDGEEPALETSYYDDTYFRFTRLDRAAMIEASAYPAPWMGNFLECGGQLSVRNLGGVYGLVRRSDALRWRFGATPKPSDFEAATLAQWYVIFRVHHAIWRDLEKQGLPRAMSVVVGDHDFGPGFTSAYIAKRGDGHGKAAERVLERRARDRRRAFDRHTEDLLKQLRDHRRDVRSWPADRNPDKRATFVGFVEARERMTLSILGLDPVRRSWQMDDAEFKTLLERVRHEREKRLAA